MNFNFCRFHCGKSWHPSRILKTAHGEWYVVMNDIVNHNDKCDYVRIEPAQDLLDNPPNGWCRINNNELLFDYGNAEDVLWKVRLVAGDTSCPYVAEHTMYDIQHEKRMSEWRERESKRLELIGDRMRKYEENNAKADC